MILFSLRKILWAGMFSVIPLIFCNTHASEKLSVQKSQPCTNINNSGILLYSRDFPSTIGLDVKLIPVWLDNGTASAKIGDKDACLLYPPHSAFVSVLVEPVGTGQYQIASGGSRIPFIGKRLLNYRLDLPESFLYEKHFLTQPQGRLIIYQGVREAEIQGIPSLWAYGARQLGDDIHPFVFTMDSLRDETIVRTFPLLYWRKQGIYPSEAQGVFQDTFEEDQTRTLCESIEAGMSTIYLDVEAGENGQLLKIPYHSYKLSENCIFYQRTPCDIQRQASLHSKTTDDLNDGSELRYLEMSGLGEEMLNQIQAIYCQANQEDEAGKGEEDQVYAKLTPLQQEVQQKYNERLDRAFADNDDFHRSYAATGAMIEAQLSAEYEEKGFYETDEAILQQIFSHRRPPTPPRTNEAYIEGSKVAIKKAIPQWAKDPIKGTLRKFGAKASYVYGLLPEGWQKGLKISMGFAGSLMPGFPTSVRQVLRDAYIPAWFAQDCGDALSLAPIVGTAAKTLSICSISKSAASRATIVEALDLANTDNIIMRAQIPSNLSIKVLQKVNLKFEGALTNEHFGLKKGAVRGTYKLQKDVFTVQVDWINGELKNPIGAMNNLRRIALGRVIN